jgi:hypothetical protein
MTTDLKSDAACARRAQIARGGPPSLARGRAGGAPEIRAALKFRVVVRTVLAGKAPALFFSSARTAGAEKNRRVSLFGGPGVGGRAWR